MAACAHMGDFRTAHIWLDDAIVFPRPLVSDMWGSVKRYAVSFCVLLFVNP